MLDVSLDFYLNEFFKDADILVTHEENYIKRNALTKPIVNYYALRRFLFTALQNFYDLDEKFLVPVLGKLSSNLKYLIEFYSRLNKQSKNIEMVYQKYFLEKIPAFKALEDEKKVLLLTKDKLEEKMAFHESIYKSVAALGNKMSEEDKQRYILNKKFYADATHHFGEVKTRLQELLDEIHRFHEAYRPEFLKKFNTLRIQYLKRLLTCINIKSYYLDKMLWDVARCNRRIVAFLVDSNIDGFFDTKTFLKYYLNSIDLANTNDREWHTILVENMKLLD